MLFRLTASRLMYGNEEKSELEQFGFRFDPFNSPYSDNKWRMADFCPEMEICTTEELMHFVDAVGGQVVVAGPTWENNLPTIEIYNAARE